MGIILYSSRGCTTGVLLWTMWEIQCYGSGTAGTQLRGSLWPLWSHLLSKDSPYDSHTIGKYKCFLTQKMLVYCCIFLYLYLFCLLHSLDNAYGVCPHQKPDLSRCEAWEFPGGPTWLQKATYHPHNWLWLGKRIHWLRDQATHPIQRTQEFDWNC